MTKRDVDRIHFVTRHFNELRGLLYGVPLGLLTLSIGGTTYFANRPYQVLRALFLLGGLFLLGSAGRYYRRTFGVVERQPVDPAPRLDSLSIYSPAGPAPRLERYELIPPIAWRLLIAVTLGFVLLLTLRAYSPGVEIQTDESLIQKPWQSLHSDVSFFRSDKPMPGEVGSELPVQVIYAFFGSLFVGVWLWRGFRLSQIYYLAFGALLLGLSAFGAIMGFFLTRDQGIFNALLPLEAHLWIALLLCGSTTILAGVLDHRQIVRALRQPLALPMESLS
jgi:hypothetical protein